MRTRLGSVMDAGKYCQNEPAKGLTMFGACSCVYHIAIVDRPASRKCNGLEKDIEQAEACCGTATRLVDASEVAVSRRSNLGFSCNASESVEGL